MKQEYIHTTAVRLGKLTTTPDGYLDWEVRQIEEVLEKVYEKTYRAGIRDSITSLTSLRKHLART